MEVSCPKPLCRATRWVPTGRVVLNRRRRMAAVVRCSKCGYHWRSTLPEALEAAQMLLESRGESMPTLATATESRRTWKNPNPMPELPGARDFEPVGAVLAGSLASSPRLAQVARDFKSDAAGGDE